MNNICTLSDNYNELVLKIEEVIPYIRNCNQYHDFSETDICCICREDRRIKGWSQNCLRSLTLEDILITLRSNPIQTIENYRKIWNEDILYSEIETVILRKYDLGIPLSEQRPVTIELLHSLVCK